MHKEWQLAVAVPRWAWRLYRRHWPVIAGLSLIPSIQRLVVVNWDKDIPASELLVALVRLVLLVTIWRLAGPTGRLRLTFVKEHCPASSSRAAC